ncbi:hypothetical protein DAPPUDRAFT_249449 [Daphnia pulex]|uniref:Uncharacterized protein n=1 Tax=Daphnia pulex TaxID=6669 RepID=E9GWP2_DAPPU|nr:hypothetical protein DAPPUDRAFT_249449 [Daphnia pulex]|eukprot:EFX76144.1 hypothetical protein DAPPUDRAFT_249449 [Daphnia pulex]
MPKRQSPEAVQNVQSSANENCVPRSRSPLQSRRPTPPVVAPVLVLLPVRAPAPAMVVPPHLDRFQCPNFRINGFYPARELCIYDHGYQPPDQGIREENVTFMK